MKDILKKICDNCTPFGCSKDDEEEKKEKNDSES